MTDETAFVRQLEILAACYGRRVDSAAKDGWWSALRSLPDDEAFEAMEVASRTCTDLPSPAIILAIARDARRQRALESAGSAPDVEPPREPGIEAAKARLIDWMENRPPEADVRAAEIAAGHNAPGWTCFKCAHVQATRRCRGCGNVWINDPPQQAWVASRNAPQAPPDGSEVRPL